MDTTPILKRHIYREKEELPTIQDGNVDLYYLIVSSFCSTKTSHTIFGGNSVFSGQKENDETTLFRRQGGLRNGIRFLQYRDEYGNTDFEELENCIDFVLEVSKNPVQKYNITCLRIYKIQNFMFARYPSKPFTVYMMYLGKYKNLVLFLQYFSDKKVFLPAVYLLVDKDMTDFESLKLEKSEIYSIICEVFQSKETTDNQEFNYYQNRSFVSKTEFLKDAENENIYEIFDQKFKEFFCKKE